MLVNPLPSTFWVGGVHDRSSTPLVAAAQALSPRKGTSSAPRASRTKHLFTMSWAGSSVQTLVPKGGVVRRESRNVPYSRCSPAPAARCAAVASGRVCAGLISFPLWCTGEIRGPLEYPTRTQPTLGSNTLYRRSVGGEGDRANDRAIH